MTYKVEVVFEDSDISTAESYDLQAVPMVGDEVAHGEESHMVTRRIFQQGGNVIVMLKKKSTYNLEGFA